MSTSWIPQVDMRVEVEKMGAGTIKKPTPKGAMVQLDRYGIEVEVQKELMRPLSGNTDKEILIDTSHNNDEDMNLIMGAMGMSKEAGASKIEPAILYTEGNTTDPSLLSIEPELPKKNLIDPSMVLTRKTLESLRFGLVPHAHIDELTIGYQDLKEWVISCLPDATNGTQRLHKVVGPFGMGKSHTMAVIRHLSEQAGYLTAKVEVDAQNISLSEPTKLFDALFSTLKGKEFETETPLLNIFVTAINNGIQSDLFKSFMTDYFKNNIDTLILLQKIDHIDKYDTLLECALTGSEEYTASQINAKISMALKLYRWQMSLRSPISRKLNDRPYDFLEAVVGCTLLTKMAGYKGLIITIDEFEVEDMLTRSRYDKLIDLLQAIGPYMKRTSLSLPNAPLAIFFGTVGQENNLGESVLNEYVNANGGSNYLLTGWDQSQRLELAQKIYNLYQRSYELPEPFRTDLPAMVEKQLESRGYDDSGLIRRFIKWYVAELDMKYGPPGS